MSRPTFDNRNENRISIKTDSTVKLIKELAKLGVFKSKKKTKRRADTGMDGIKQDNVMVGYTKSLGGPLGPQMRNIPPIQQIEAGMSPQQIEDIQRTNSARFAALQGEVAQHRSETRETIGGLAGAAARKFSQLDNAVSGIVNIDSERFRGSTFPALSQGDQPVDPFSYARSSNDNRNFEVPDTSDVPMDQTLNEGGPDATAEFAETLYPEGESADFGLSTSEMGGAEDKITASGGGKRIFTGGELPEGVAFLEVGEEIPQLVIGKKRSEILASRGLGPLPPNSKNTPTEEMQEYYINFTRAFNVSPNFFITGNRENMFKEMVRIIGE